jgi:hypothetical protein
MSNSAADTVAAPVDGIAWLLRKAGVNVGDPVGGSDWMAQQGLTAPVEQGASRVAGETLGLLAPGAAASKAVRGLFPSSEQALKQATESVHLGRMPGGIFDPKPQPAREFASDYQTSIPGPTGSRLTNDVEGRNLTAPLVVGRQRWGGADVVPGIEQIENAARSLGATVGTAPSRGLGTDLGQYLARKYNAAPEIRVADNLSWEVAPRVFRHEAGHLIDDIAGGIDFKGASTELQRLYSDLNTGQRVANWRKGVTSPEQQRYKGGDVPKEYAAEAVRAYLTDPNYIKTVAPKVAAAIRKRVNENPELSRVIQFNSAAGAGLLGGNMLFSEQPMD